MCEYLLSTLNVCHTKCVILQSDSHHDPEAPSFTDQVHCYSVGQEYLLLAAKGHECILVVDGSSGGLRHLLGPHPDNVLTHTQTNSRLCLRRNAHYAWRSHTHWQEKHAALGIIIGFYFNNVETFSVSHQRPLTGVLPATVTFCNLTHTLMLVHVISVRHLRGHSSLMWPCPFTSLILNFISVLCDLKYKVKNTDVSQDERFLKTQALKWCTYMNHRLNTSWNTLIVFPMSFKLNRGRVNFDL